MKQVVLSLAPLPAELVKALILQTQGVPDFDVIEGHGMGQEELEEALSRADAVMGDYTFRQGISSNLVAHARSVKLIQQPSVGYQHIDVGACAAAGIKVANTPGANTISVAEHTVAWGLCLLRNLLPAQRSMREGRWEQMGIKPVELWGKTWGLVGLGQIGRAVALRLKPFGLGRVVYTDIVRADREEEGLLGVEYVELADLLRLSDIVSLHVPLTGATANLLGRDELNAMKPTSYLINVARGGIVDEQALAEALSAGRIAGAAVDVFSEEPVPPENPLLGLPEDRVLLSPHVAGVSNEAAGRIINMATENIARVLKGEEPLYLVAEA
ncbi:MAG TPA: 2-hydroxyacid dehydrogenase [Deltaproteobacteria bacterium]|jgi:phosphoglycerate dehydrogenase-like enzyme|nr:2-hydroxyacid dehydrogenase [Deltaproteobacteria bacterium]HOI07066.1 2-hydroxyacid dehydrogenase [Deltaproteobacteria bacterium]